MTMKVAETKALIAALQAAVNQAEAMGKDEIEQGVLAALLDARLGAALDDLQAALRGE